MENSIAQQAALVFTSSCVLIGISLLLIAPTWRNIKEIQNRLPYSQRKIVFNLRHIKDKKEKDRAMWLSILFIGCAFLALSIALNLLSIIGVTSTMLDFHIGPFQESNYNWGKYFLSASVVMVCSGFFLIGIVRIIEALYLRDGEASPLEYNEENTISKGTKKAKQKKE